MFNAAFFHQALHMTLAAFAATGFAVAGIHAYFLRRNPKSAFHRHALRHSRSPSPASRIPLQILSGDISARAAADCNPRNSPRWKRITTPQPARP